MSDEAIQLELRLTEVEGVGRSCDLAAMCGKSDSELDELLLRLCGFGK